jgi:hypothetical protein
MPHRARLEEEKEEKKSPADNRSKEQKDDGKEDEEVNLSFAQLQGKRCSCRKAGHKSPSCRDKNKPKDEWAINKAQLTHEQAAASKPKFGNRSYHTIL